MAKTWLQKRNSGKQIKLERLDKKWGDIPANGLMLVATPEIIDKEIRLIPPGSTLTIKELRKKLAIDYAADGTCHLSTAIFVRICAEAAWEELQAGVSLSQVTPFWRIIDPESDLAKKLSCGTEFIYQQRALES